MRREYVLWTVRAEGAALPVIRFDPFTQTAGRIAWRIAVAPCRVLTVVEVPTRRCWWCGDGVRMGCLLFGWKGRWACQAEGGEGAEEEEGESHD